jgi:hypothetical protein
MHCHLMQVAHKVLICMGTRPGPPISQATTLGMATRLAGIISTTTSAVAAAGEV